MIMIKNTNLLTNQALNIVNEKKHRKVVYPERN